MENLRIGNSLCAVFCICALFLSGCRPGADTSLVELPEAAHAAMYDTSSVSFVDFSDYGELRYLPIGLFDADSTSMTLLETFMSMDCFDNITGARRSDGIVDFAGEHFQYYTAVSDEECFQSTLFLMQNRYWNSFRKERSKIVVADGFFTAEHGLEDMAALSQHNEAGVKVITSIEAGVREMFDRLATDNISTFTVACLCDSSENARPAYSEVIKKIAAEQDNPRTISIISGKNSLEGLERLIGRLHDINSKSPLKVILMDGADEEFIASCNYLLDRYRDKFENGTYPYKSILADRIIFINPALCAAIECYEELRSSKNLALRAERQKVSYFYGF